MIANTYYKKKHITIKCTETNKSQTKNLRFFIYPKKKLSHLLRSRDKLYLIKFHFL